MSPESMAETLKVPVEEIEDEVAKFSFQSENSILHDT